MEYDDVITKQRETIYAERDKVLRNEDLTETVEGFLADELDALVGQYLAVEVLVDWNMHGLSTRVRTPRFGACGTDGH